VVQVAQEARGTVRSVAATRQMAPHREPVEQGIEPKRFLRVRMVDVAISGKKWLPTAGVLMGAAEQCLSEVEQCISSPSIAKID